MKCEVRGERKGLSSLLMSPTIPQLSPVFSGLSGSPLEMRDAHSIHKEGNNSGWRVLPGWVLLLHWKAMCGQPSPRTGQPWKKLELFGISWISPKELVYKHTSPPGTPYPWPSGYGLPSGRKLNPEHPGAGCWIYTNIYIHTDRPMQTDIDMNGDTNIETVLTLILFKVNSQQAV